MTSGERAFSFVRSIEGSGVGAEVEAEASMGSLMVSAILGEV
jgi:hypothetical protein